MKGNTDKCHLYYANDKSSEIHIGESIVKSSDYEKLRGIKIDLKFHFWWSCKKANQKLQALASAINSFWHTI